MRRILVAACLCLAACGPRSAERPGRLLTADEARPFTADSVGELVEVRSESGFPRALADWHVEGAGLVERRASELVLEGRDSGLRVVSEVRLAAAGVDTVEIGVSGLQLAAQPELRWRVEGGGACEKCRLRLLWRDGQGPGKSTYRFDVSEAPAWNGVVTQMELVPTNLRSNKVVLRSIRLLGRAVDPEQLGTAADRSWLFTAEDETRPAVLLAPEHNWRVSASVLRGDSLTFAVARPGARSREADLRVLGRDSGGRKVELGRWALSETSEGEGWKEIAVDLSPVGSGEIELEFEIGGERASRIGDLLFVGGPRIVRAVPRGLAPDILLVSIDTLRADRMSLYGYQRATTPKLDRWASESGATVFEKAIAAASSTLPAHASLFTGLDVLRHGAFLGHALEPSFRTLAELLSEHGYRTLAVTGGGYVHPRFGLAQGFDRFFAWPRGSADAGDELAAVFERAEKLLASDDDTPRFLFLHTYEVHAPYRARQPYFSRWNQTDPAVYVQPWLREEREDEGYLTRDRWPRIWDAQGPRDLRRDEIQLLGDLYDSGVSRVDDYLGGLLLRLHESGRDRNMIVIVTADHGESLGERDLFDHGYLYDTNLHVPLVVRSAETRGPPRVASQVRQIDVLPTILALASISFDGRIDGRSLADWFGGSPPSAEPPAWSYAPETNHGISVRRRGLKFILRDALVRPLQNVVELYDLAADPAEDTDLSEIDAERTEQLTAAAEQKLSEGATGTEVIWSNRSGEWVRGTLEWPVATRHNSKWSGPRVGSFRMPTAGEIRFELPPHSEARTRFAISGDSTRYRMFVRGWRGESATEGELTHGALCETGVVLVSYGTNSPEEGAEGGFSVRAREAGTCGDSARDDRIRDAELAEGLRALGYLR